MFVLATSKFGWIELLPKLTIWMNMTATIMKYDNNAVPT